MRYNPRVITTGQNKAMIAVGIVGAAVGVTLLWLAESLQLQIKGIRLPELLAMSSFLLTLGGMLMLLIGGISFARCQPFGQSFRLC